MNYPQAIVAAAGILAGAIVLNQLGQTAPVPPLPWPGGRYQIAATPGQRVANAWWLDVKTGDLYRCFATGGDVRAHLPACADDRAQRFETG